MQSSLRVIEFYCCGNHLSQGQMTVQDSKSLNIRFRVGSSQKNSTRSLCLIKVLYIQSTHSLYYYLMFASRPPFSRLQEVDFISFYFFFLIFILFSFIFHFSIFKTLRVGVRSDWSHCHINHET